MPLDRSSQHLSRAMSGFKRRYIFNELKTDKSKCGLNTLRQNCLVVSTVRGRPIIFSLCLTSPRGCLAAVLNDRAPPHGLLYDRPSHNKQGTGREIQEDIRVDICDHTWHIQCIQMRRKWSPQTAAAMDDFFISPAHKLRVNTYRRGIHLETNMVIISTQNTLIFVAIVQKCTLPIEMHYLSK